MSRYRLLTYLAFQSWWIAGWMVAFFLTPAIVGLSEIGSTKLVVVLVTPLVLALIGHFALDARKLTQPEATAIVAKEKVSLGRQFIQGIGYMLAGLVMLIALISAMDIEGLQGDIIYWLMLLALGILPPLARSGTVERRAAEKAALSSQASAADPGVSTKAPEPTTTIQLKEATAPIRRIRITHASLQCWWLCGLLLDIDISPNVPAWLQTISKDTWYVELLMVALAGAGYWIWRLRGPGATPAAEKRSYGYLDYQVKNFQSFGSWRFGFIAVMGIVSLVIDPVLAMPGVLAVIILLPLALVPPWVFARFWP